jgi:hypothetical protein
MIARIVVDVEVPDSASASPILEEVEQLLSLTPAFAIEAAHVRVELTDDQNQLISQTIRGVDSHGPVGKALRLRAANNGKVAGVTL